MFQLVVSLEMVRVGVKIPYDGNRTNTYGHVAMMHGHVWRTLCSVWVGARTSPCTCRANLAPTAKLINPSDKMQPDFWLHIISGFNSLFTGLVRVGVKIPQHGNHTNTHGHVAMMHGHVWRTLCSVCATGARVAQLVPCNS